MSDQTLIEKIRGLPPEKVAKVEEFVDLLRQSDDERQLTAAMMKLANSSAGIKKFLAKKISTLNFSSMIFLNWKP